MLNQRQWSRLELTLTSVSHGQLTQTWMVAQELQLPYARSHDLADAKDRLWRILGRCARTDVPELLRLARTLDAWCGKLLAYWTSTGQHGVSSAPIEATKARRATAAARRHAGAARVELRQAMTHRTAEHPAVLAAGLPAHPRLNPPQPRTSTTKR